MGMLKNFKAYQLAKLFYQGCKPLRLPTHLKDQLMRSSSSIALNLAEAAGNRTEKEQLRAFTLALGSLRESEAILDIEQVQDPAVCDLANQLGAVLFKLCRISKHTKQPDSDSDSTGATQLQTR